MSTIIGLTGSLATGKTSVARVFEKLGAKVIDADKIAHRAIHRGGICFKKVVKEFGPTILKTGDVDRKKLAEIVFEDPKQLVKLEKIIHPVVIREIKEQIKSYRKNKQNKIVVIDVPLLFESKLNREVDRTIVVKASRKNQMERAARKLKLTKSEAQQRLKRQMPLSEKVRRADIIIDNNGTIKETEKQVKIIWQKI